MLDVAVLDEHCEAVRSGLVAKSYWRAAPVRSRQAGQDPHQRFRCQGIDRFQQVQPKDFSDQTANHHSRMRLYL